MGQPSMRWLNLVHLIYAAVQVKLDPFQRALILQGVEVASLLLSHLVGSLSELLISIARGQWAPFLQAAGRAAEKNGKQGEPAAVMGNGKHTCTPLSCRV